MVTPIQLSRPTGWRGRWKRWVCRRRGHDPQRVVVRGQWTPRPRSRPQPVFGFGEACRRCREWTQEPDWPPQFNPSYADIDVVVDPAPGATAMPAIESSWDR